MAKAKKSYFEEFFRFSPKWEFFWKNLVSSVLTLKTFFLHVRFQKNPVGRFWEKLLTDLLTYLHKGTMKILCYKTVHLFYLHVCENNQKPEGNALLKVCILCVPIFYFLPKVNTKLSFKWSWPDLPKLPKIKSLQNPCNISRKKWGMTLIFVERRSITVICKLILSFLMGVVGNP